MKDFKALASACVQTHQEFQAHAVKLVDQSLSIRNWLFGWYIVEYEQGGNDRAQYGDKLYVSLSKELQKQKVKGASRSILYSCKDFYLAYPRICQILPQHIVQKIFQSLPGKFELPSSTEISPRKTQEAKTYDSLDPTLLLRHFSFTAFVELVRIEKPLKRLFYEVEGIKGNWSARELKRQIGSLLYERTGLSIEKEKLLQSVHDRSDTPRPEEVIRDPYVLEFLGLKEESVYSEHELETALLDHIQAFLVELGTGFCFEARQKRITIDNEHDRVDLVLYHRILKCHVLVELKTRPFKHADAGQMNFYLGYYQEKVMREDDNPPIGLILCSDKSHTKAKYATIGNDRTFISRYSVELPSEEELEKLIEKDRERVENTSLQSYNG